MGRWVVWLGQSSRFKPARAVMRQRLQEVDSSRPKSHRSIITEQVVRVCYGGGGMAALSLDKSVRTTRCAECPRG